VQAPSQADTALVSMIRQGNLVVPHGASAYDAFLRMKQQGLSGNDLSLLQAQVLPVLRDWSDKAFQRWHDESNLTGEDWQNLQRVCAWITQLEPSRTDFQARLAYANAQLEFLRGDYRSASQHFSEATRLAPKWALPVNALGRIAVATGKPSDGEELYKQAVALEPDWVYPNLNLAGHYVRSKRYDLALPYAERAVNLTPSKPTPHYRLGQIYQNLGRLSEAREELQRALDALERNPSTDLNPDQIRADIRALEARLPK
jgi:tetratricopeptide (TPR) repeat protein